MEVNKEKLIQRLNDMNVKEVVTPEGRRFRFKGDLPESVTIVAPFANTFASESNTEKWLRTVEATVLRDVKEIKLDSPVTLQDALGEGADDQSEEEEQSEDAQPQAMDDMTNAELREYAQVNFGVTLAQQLNKAELIAKINELQG